MRRLRWVGGLSNRFLARYRMRSIVSMIQAVGHRPSGSQPRPQSLCAGPQALRCVRQAITPRPLPRSSQDHSHQTLFSITTHQLFSFHFERFSSLPKRPATLLGYQQAENLLKVISHVQSWMLRASSCSLSPTTFLVFCFSPALSVVELGIMVRVV